MKIASIALSILAIVFHTLDKVYNGRERGRALIEGGNQINFLYENFSGLSGEIFAAAAKADQAGGGDAAHRLGLHPQGPPRRAQGPHRPSRRARQSLGGMRRRKSYRSGRSRPEQGHGWPTAHGRPVHPLLRRVRSAARDSACGAIGRLRRERVTCQAGSAPTNQPHHASTCQCITLTRGLCTSCTAALSCPCLGAVRIKHGHLQFRLDEFN